MATQYTNLLGFALPVTGELSGTWGDVVNNSITELVEDSIAGSATASVTSGDWTLTTTGSGAANQARSAILIPTGTPGVSRNIIAPSSSKAYIVVNQSDAAVVVKGSATTGVSIAAGIKAIVAWNGTDFAVVGSSGAVTSVGATTPIQSSGGTTPTISITQASTSTNGYLSSTDWNTFNSKGAGSVSSVSGAGTVNGITLTGTVTSTGSLTLGGTLSNVSLATQVTGTLPVANGGTGVTSSTGLGAVVLGTTPTITALREVKTAIAAANIDLSVSNYFTKTISGDTTFTVSNTPTTGTSASFILDLTDGGSATITWWSGMTWVGGTAPELTSSGRDSLGFYTYDGGTVWTGLVLGKDIS